MKAYVDSSILIRLIFGEPHPLGSRAKIETAVSSEVVPVECLRAIDRASFDSTLADEDLAARRATAFELLQAVNIVPLGSEVLDRAAAPFPTSIGTLDAIHLSSALLAREHLDDLVFATHVRSLGIAAPGHGLSGRRNLNRRRTTVTEPGV